MMIRYWPCRARRGDQVARSGNPGLTLVFERINIDFERGQSCATWNSWIIASGSTGRKTEKRASYNINIKVCTCYKDGGVTVTKTENVEKERGQKSINNSMSSKLFGKTCLSPTNTINTPRAVTDIP